MVFKKNSKKSQKIAMCICGILHESIKNMIRLRPYYLGVQIKEISINGVCALEKYPLSVNEFKAKCQELSKPLGL